MFLKPGPFSHPVWCPWWGLTQFLLEHTERWALVPSWAFSRSSVSLHRPLCVSSDPGPGKDAVLVRQGCHSKYHRLGARNPHKLIFSQFWRLEAQDQGISRLGLQTPLFLACRCHSLAACLRGYPSRHNPDLSSSSWNISPIGLGPHPNGLILSPLEWPYLTVSSWMARILPSSSWAARF